MNPFRKLAGQTAIYGLPTIIGRLLNYLLVPLYTRVFVPEEYGVVTEIYAYVAFLFVILTYGMETAFFRFSTSESDRSKVFGTSIFSIALTSSVFILLVFLFTNQIADVIGYLNHPEYIRWFAIILAADALASIPYAFLRLENKSFRFALIKVTNIILNIFLNLLFIVFIPALLNNQPDSFLITIINRIYDPGIGVGYIFIANLIASLVTILMLAPAIKNASILQPDMALLKKMLKYSWPLLIFGLAGIINETFDRVILKHLLPESSNPMAQLGIYGACYKISILMTLFIQTYRYAAEPFFFDHSQKKDAKKTYSELMHYFIIVCLFIYLLIMLNIDIVLLFIGPEYREGVGVIPVLLWANLFLGIFYNLSIWFKLTDRTITGAMISVAGAIITLGFNFLLIPIMGYLGAAWATFICYLFMMIASWYLGRKYYSINYKIAAAGFYTLLTLIIYLLSILTSRLQTELQYLFNYLMIGIFIIIVYFNERSSLQRVRID